MALTRSFCFTEVGYMVDNTCRCVTVAQTKVVVMDEVVWAATFGLVLIFWMRTGPATNRKTLGVTKRTISSAVMPRGMLLLSEPGGGCQGKTQHGKLCGADQVEKATELRLC
jgi:hypothetical protein